jgi:hypothetical protein
VQVRITIGKIDHWSKRHEHACSAGQFAASASICERQICAAYLILASRARTKIFVLTQGLPEGKQ